MPLDDPSIVDTRLATRVRWQMRHKTKKLRIRQPKSVPTHLAPFRKAVNHNPLITPTLSWVQTQIHLPECEILHADKGYDANAVRRQVEQRGVMPNIPPKANRKWKNCFSPFLYRDRNTIECIFCRLKDFRRIATRYDRLTVNFMAAVCIAATVSYWL